MATYSAFLREEGVDGRSITVDPNTKQIGANYEKAIWGQTYYVDSTNGTTTNDGLSPGTALSTIAAAITLSNAYIASTGNTYKVNRIYVLGGTYSETLTVMPMQCEVIGVGTRSGWEPLINGVSTFATAGQWSRFINLHFYQATAAPVVTIPAGSHGYAFINCRISDGGSSTHGLDITDSYDGLIQGCKFDGNPPCPIGISFAGTSCGGTKVLDNYISATTIGIEVENGMTADYGLVIKDNSIYRCDPNADAPLTEGIAFQDTSGRSHAMVIHNFIAATDAIAFDGAYGGDRDHWMCIANHVVQAATADVESDENA